MGALKRMWFFHITNSIFVILGDCHHIPNCLNGFDSTLLTLLLNSSVICYQIKEIARTRTGHKSNQANAQCVPFAF